MKNAFCFIVCTNNMIYFDECARYINRLSVPDGYEVTLLAIENAKSITSGYNEGMNASDARYKIYLHQDAFIINQNFLFDILSLFQDSSIGIIGVVGSPQLPYDGMMWHGPRVGALYRQQPYTPSVSQSNTKIDYTEVECVDGLIMITQYDLPWREDLFTGWDFYDISQCFEFRKSNYKVVVPEQVNPWVIHDDGIMTLWNYDKNRQLFLKEYKDMLQHE